MLWNPPLPQEKPVLRFTAERMELTYWEREPLTLDGAFVSKTYKAFNKLPVPIIVALEHENSIGGFVQEMFKLSYVRCPVKVGITYTNIHAPITTKEKLRECKTKIEGWLENVSAP